MNEDADGQNVDTIQEDEEEQEEQDEETEQEESTKLTLKFAKLSFEF